MSIIDMNTKFLQLTKIFNTADFMKGQLLPFSEDTYTVEEHIYTCLLEPSEYDGIAQSLTQLQVLFLFHGKLSNKLLTKDNLPGGKLVGMDHTVVDKFKFTPKKQTVLLRVFGRLDY